MTGHQPAEQPWADAVAAWEHRNHPPAHRAAVRVLRGLLWVLERVPRAWGRR